MKRHIITSINEFHGNSDYDRLLQVRMDKIFDTMEEYRTKHDLQVEVKDVNFKEYTRFSEEHLIEIVDFISKVNREGKIYHCDFPTFWVSKMDDLGEGPEIDELEIDQIPISIEYKYTHVFQQFTHLRRGFDYELEDRYKITFTDSGITDEWSSLEILKLMEEGAFHSEYGIIGLTPEDVKTCIGKI
jgi:hypothetical protein